MNPNLLTLLLRGRLVGKACWRRRSRNFCILGFTTSGVKMLHVPILMGTLSQHCWSWEIIIQSIFIEMMVVERYECKLQDKYIKTIEFCPNSIESWNVKIVHVGQLIMNSGCDVVPLSTVKYCSILRTASHWTQVYLSLSITLYFCQQPTLVLFWLFWL